MNKEQAVTYLRFSGFSDEQIKAIEGAFTCDKCVYSTSEGCQYDDITETIPPFETSEDAISRKEAISIASIATLSVNQVVTALEKLPPVNPQKPICPSAGIDCEDCPAYEPKTGHWIRVDKDKLRCSECDVIHFIAQYPQGKIAWCPNCGAKMVEPQEGGEQE